ncbi:hypothetical protein C1H46_008500 [Malus baccata]|uniref:Mediator of RNA polymerase II transcription subunit 6 n=1 Tax=Malus baccata TaxID=106549 RepID=A0A540N428_MALBA|nr:hypothetical protein C1H46_008500 [Malus baccata]
MIIHPPVAPPNMEGGPPPVVAQPPGTDMTDICFKDQLWLNSYPPGLRLLRYLYVLRLDLKMSGTEYWLSEVMEPHLFVFRKQQRDGPEKVTPMLTYYVLNGTIYQAPQLCTVFAALIARALHYISKAFTTAALKAGEDWIRVTMSLMFMVSNSFKFCDTVDSENEAAAFESKVTNETIDFKEVKRVDLILQSLQRKIDPIIDQGPGKRM